MTSTRGRPRYDDILTPREWQAIDLLEQGLTNEQIAERLQISFGGAKFHVAEIISKLGAEDRHEAVRLARRRQPTRAGLLAWIPERLRLVSHRPLLVSGVAAAAVLASVLLLGALLTNWFPWRSSGQNEPDLSQALADFESGGSQHDFLAQAQFDPTGCVTGEEARNPRHPSMGFVMPLQRYFNTIEEAERFLCLPIPRPRSSELRLRPGDPGWRSSSGDRIALPVYATRSHDLEALLNSANGGKGRMARIRYLPSRGSGPEVEFKVGLGDPHRVGTMEKAQTVTLQDVEGELFRIPNAYGYPDSVVVRWAKNGYGFIASTDWLDDFVLDEFLAILETVS